MSEGAAHKIDVATLRRLLRYEPETGALHWNARLESDFGGKDAARVCASWNAKYAGKLALRIDPSTGYVSGSMLGVKVLAHRAIWAMQTGAWPRGDIDHVNGRRADNRWSNLRSVERDENARNQRMRATNTSGMMGVMWIAARAKWRARIMVGGRNQSLGCFDTFEQACEARRAAEFRLGFHENHGRAA